MRGLHVHGVCYLRMPILFPMHVLHAIAPVTSPYARSVAVRAKFWWTIFAWHVSNLRYNADVCVCRCTWFVRAEDRARRIDIRGVYRCECSLYWWKSLWSLFSESHESFSKRCVGCSNAGRPVVLGRTFLLSSSWILDILEKLAKIETDISRIYPWCNRDGFRACQQSISSILHIRWLYREH